MRAVDQSVLVVAGEGTQRGDAERAAERAGVADRVMFLGTVGDDDLIELYAGALAVVYPPYDEDFGYVTLEAFLARKPVVTCSDSGGPNEFVIDGVNGCVCDPSADAIGAAIRLLDADRTHAAALVMRARGGAAHHRDGVIEKLVRMTKLIIQIPCLNEAKRCGHDRPICPRSVPGIDTVEIMVMTRVARRDGGTSRAPRRTPRHPPSTKQRAGRGLHHGHRRLTQARRGPS